jgi:hypothetical protein
MDKTFPFIDEVMLAERARCMGIIFLLANDPIEKLFARDVIQEISSGKAIEELEKEIQEVERSQRSKK